MEKNTKLMYILAIFIGLISSLIFFINAKSDEEKEAAKLSLNFEITYFIIVVVAGGIIGFVSGLIGMPTISYAVSGALWVWHAFVNYKAMKSAEEGKSAEFPINFNLVK